MKELFSALLSQLETGSDVMLATMIEHAGSVPRGMGSQMLLNGSGLVAGTIGGGVGEKQMTELGVSLLAEKKCGVHTYALHGKTGESMGSVCGGAITVYFQYVSSEDSCWKQFVQAVLEHIAQHKGGWLVQDLHGGAPSLIDADGTLVMGQMPENKESLCRAFSVKTEDHFVMPLSVGERAVIFGAGHCAQALCPLLSSVGFRVTVYDNRPEQAQKALFPQAERVICAPFEQLSEQLNLAEDDYIVTMSSTHSDDLCIQHQVLQMDHAYVGMIGSKPKRTFIHGKLLEYGIPQEMIDRVHTPIGLNIKAVTPAEIAVSIAGEMVLVRAENREKAQGKA